MNGENETDRPTEKRENGEKQRGRKNERREKRTLSSKREVK